MPKLVLFLPDGTALDIPLDRTRMRIGRRPGIDLCLPYAAVSGEHAVVAMGPAGVTIEDLGSTNGTLVNGVAIAHHVLADGDRIDIGRQLLVYLEDASAPAPPMVRRRGQERPSAEIRELLQRTPDEAAAAPGTAASAPVVTVLSGPSAGRRLALTKDESLIGRVGIQVAAIRRGADGCRVVPVEGGAPPRVNGIPLESRGAELRPGDEIEIAGARLEFAVPQGPARS